MPVPIGNSNVSYPGLFQLQTESGAGPYDVAAFCRLHDEEHEEAGRFEVAKHLWKEGLKLLEAEDAMCIQIFGDALTKYMRVYNPYNPIFLKNYHKLPSLLSQQLQLLNAGQAGTESTATIIKELSSPLQVKQFTPVLNGSGFPCTMDEWLEDMEREGMGEEFAVEESMEPEERSKVREKKKRLDKARIRKQGDSKSNSASEGSSVQNELSNTSENAPSKQGNSCTQPRNGTPLSETYVSLDDMPDSDEAVSSSADDLSKERVITFKFHITLVRAIMEPMYDEDTRLPLTRRERLLRAVSGLEECEGIKQLAYRYGSFDFWKGLFLTELCEFLQARKHFKDAIYFDHRLRVYCSHLYNQAPVTQIFRQALSILVNNHYIGAELDGAERGMLTSLPQRLKRGKFQYDAVYWMGKCVLDEALHSMTSTSITSSRNKTAAWQQYEQVKDLISQSAASKPALFTIHSILCNLYTFLITAPVHSEYFTDASCTILMLLGVILLAHPEKEVNVDGLCMLRSNIAKSLYCVQGWSPRNVDGIVGMAQSCWDELTESGVLVGPIVRDVRDAQLMW
ncbi:hypothetical protein SeMB42_g02232 [Synchytrium endobioticum]|uniref:Uncharacterized protein n=1 Tax=Synchytrium endobioticum TaxID=286115 RepID=A0A507DGR7_9FUNG|nr:hypothetical protein SeMB42_g02232 [Synchytrium endobioticum]TPX50996.1 hypothetical protein SeLEV6574_g00567 [Synchytrium endobioticum]